jgi:hypothetical protein
MIILYGYFLCEYILKIKHTIWSRAQVGATNNSNPSEIFSNSDCLEMLVPKLNLHAKSLLLKHQGINVFGYHHAHKIEPVPASEFIKYLVSFSLIYCRKLILDYFSPIFTRISTIQGLSVRCIWRWLGQQICSIFYWWNRRRLCIGKSSTKLIGNWFFKPALKCAIFSSI